MQGVADLIGGGPHVAYLKSDSCSASSIHPEGSHMPSKTRSSGKGGQSRSRLYHLRLNEQFLKRKMKALDDKPQEWFARPCLLVKTNKVCGLMSSRTDLMTESPWRIEDRCCLATLWYSMRHCPLFGKPMQGTLRCDNMSRAA